MLVLYLLCVMACMSFLFGTCQRLVKKVLYGSQQDQQQANGAGDAPFNQREGFKECPICLVELGDDRVAAMCGHPFCAECIVRYWKSKGEAGIKCPYCRRNISFISMHDPSKLNQDAVSDIRRFNTLHSEDRTFLDSVRDIPFLLDRFVEEVQRTNGRILFQNYKMLFIILSALIYLVSPIDLIPEALFGIIGYADDIAVVLYAALGVASFFYNVMVERNNQAVRAR